MLAYIEVIVKDKEFSRNSLSFVCIVMWLLAGLRYKVGADWNSYFEFYQETTDAVEIGYATLNNVFSKLSVPYNVFLLFINGISLILMYIFLRKHSLVLVIGMLIFYSDLFLYFNLSGIRQAIATAITCYSITYAINRQFVKFSLLVVLASCFHLTALVFFAAYFLPRKKFSTFQLLFFAGGFLSFSFFINYFSELITLYTMKNAEFYLTQQVKSENLLGLFYVGIAKRLIIVGLIFGFGRKIINNGNFRYFFNIYLFGLAIYLTSYMISPDIGVRLSSYFITFEMVIAGNLLYFTKSRNTRLLIVTIFFAVVMYKLLGYSKDETYVYHSIIDLF
ncbi:EpsG family protein [Pedobacter sp. PACM 27299]|uniref:EpsG family protein n=1 Tax=Pedobacter sp. PACM 27299 TaxID=1727164 RepID=UPI000A73B3BC|nr:EpsG family protein [Pedobacter sp. PACM 27299]